MRRAPFAARIAAGALLAAVLPAPGEGEPDALVKLRTAYAQKVAEIDQAFEPARNEAAAGYQKDLLAVLRHMRASGDEFGVGPAEDELKRFAKERTVPPESAPGTPELIVKARGRHAEAMAAAAAAQGIRRQALDRAYAAQLELLRSRYAAASPAEADRVAREIAQLAPAEDVADAAAAPACGPPVHLPRPLLRELRAAFAPGAGGSAVEDLSGRGVRASLSGTAVVEGPRGGTAREFAGDIDALGVGELRAGPQWSLAVRARFPLVRDGRRRVLASAGYDRHHVLVDERGLLGVQLAEFVGCGRSVDALRGWHDIAAIGSLQRTYFFVDGKPAGVAKAICEEPFKALGNSATGSHPWGGALAEVLIWGRALSEAEVAALAARPR